MSEANQLQPCVRWVLDKRQYSSGYLAQVGPWQVGSADHCSTVSKGDPLTWRAVCLLPGIKDSLGMYETPEEAKKRVEQAVGYWFNRLST